jgi:hypothetical protein
MSSLSKNSIEALLRLVEDKLSCLTVFDREDAREKSYLEGTRRELTSLMRGMRATESPPAMRVAA